MVDKFFTEKSKLAQLIEHRIMGVVAPLLDQFNGENRLRNIIMCENRKPDGPDYNNGYQEIGGAGKKEKSFQDLFICLERR